MGVQTKTQTVNHGTYRLQSSGDRHHVSYKAKGASQATSLGHHDSIAGADKAVAVHHAKATAPANPKSSKNHPFKTAPNMSGMQSAHGKTFKSLKGWGSIHKRKKMKKDLGAAPMPSQSPRRRRIRQTDIGTAPMKPISNAEAATNLRSGVNKSGFQLTKKSVTFKVVTADDLLKSTLRKDVYMQTPKGSNDASSDASSGPAPTPPSTQKALYVEKASKYKENAPKLGPKTQGSQSQRSGAIHKVNWHTAVSDRGSYTYTHNPKTGKHQVSYSPHNGGGNRYGGSHEWHVPAKSQGHAQKMINNHHNSLVAGRKASLGGGSIKKGKLDAADRKKIKGKNFALPGKRYPIEDASHARNALARVSQYGSPEEKKKVQAKVHRKYPGIGKSESLNKGNGMENDLEDLFKSEIGDSDNEKPIINCPHCETPITKSEVLAKARGKGDKAKVKNDNKGGKNHRGPEKGHNTKTPTRYAAGVPKVDNGKRVTKGETDDQSADGDDDVAKSQGKCPKCSSSVTAGTKCKCGMMMKSDGTFERPAPSMQHPEVRGSEYVQYVNTGEDARIAKMIEDGGMGNAQVTQPMDKNNSGRRY